MKSKHLVLIILTFICSLNSFALDFDSEIDFSDKDALVKFACEQDEIGYTNICLYTSDFAFGMKISPNGHMNIKSIRVYSQHNGSGTSPKPESSGEPIPDGMNNKNGIDNATSNHEHRELSPNYVGEYNPDLKTSDIIITPSPLSKTPDPQRRVIQRGITPDFSFLNDNKLNDAENTQIPSPPSPPHSTESRSIAEKIGDTLRDPEISNGIKSVIEESKEYDRDRDIAEQKYTQSLHKFAQTAHNLNYDTSQIPERSRQLYQNAAEEVLRFSQEHPQSKTKPALQTDKLESFNREQIQKLLTERNYRKVSEIISMLSRDPEHKRISIESDAIPLIMDIVNGDGVAEFERINPRIPISPFSTESSKLSSPKETQGGMTVRSLANSYQALWGESEGLKGFEPNKKASYVLGASILRWADQQASVFSHDSNSIELSYLASKLLQVSGGFIDGTIDGTFETLESIEAMGGFMNRLPRTLAESVSNMTSEAISDPVHFAKHYSSATYEILKSVAKLPARLIEDAYDIKFDFIHGNEYERSRIIGKLSVNLLINYLTSEGVSKLTDKTLGIGTLSGNAFDSQILSSATNTTKGGQALSATLSLPEKLEVQLGSHLLSDVTQLIERTEPELILEARKVKFVQPHIAEDALSTYADMLQSQSIFKDQAKEYARVILNSPTIESSDYATRLMLGHIEGAPSMSFIKSPNDLAIEIDKYAKLSERLRTLNIERFDGEVWRLSKSRVTISNGQIIHQSPTDFFDFHGGSKMWTGRVAMGGSRGVNVVSASTELSLAENSTINNAARGLKTSLDEVKSYADGKAFTLHNYKAAHKNLKLDRVWNLTNAEDVMSKLNLSTELQLIAERASSGLPYNETFKIGHLAEWNKIDGILLPSAESKDGVVLHVLQGGIQNATNH